MANRTRTNRNEFHLNDDEQYILEDLTVSISTKDSKPKEQKSEYVLLTKAERSVICVL